MHFKNRKHIGNIEKKSAMKNQNNQYQHESAIIAESLLTQEMMRVSPQIARVSTGGGKYKIECEQLVIAFYAADPVSADEREPITPDPNTPLVISFESREQVDCLVKTLQKLRTEIWGLCMEFEDHKN